MPQVLHGCACVCYSAHVAGGHLAGFGSLLPPWVRKNKLMFRCGRRRLHLLNHLAGFALLSSVILWVKESYTKAPGRVSAATIASLNQHIWKLAVKLTHWQLRLHYNGFWNLCASSLLSRPWTKAGAPAMQKKSSLFYVHLRVKEIIKVE